MKAMKQAKTENHEEEETVAREKEEKKGGMRPHHVSAQGSHGRRKYLIHIVYPWRGHAEFFFVPFVARAYSRVG